MSVVLSAVQTVGRLVWQIFMLVSTFCSLYISERNVQYIVEWNLSV